MINLIAGVFFLTNNQVVNAEINNTHYLQQKIENSVQVKQNKPLQPEEGVEFLKGSGHQYDIESLFFSQDRQTLISGGLYNKIHVWNMKNKKLTRTIHAGKTGVTALAISPDGQNIYAGITSFDKKPETIRVWNIKTGKLIRTINSLTPGVLALKLTSDGKTLISGNGDNTVKLWNTQTGKLIRTLKGQAQLGFIM
jgi:WD40 repeat protein